MARALVLRMRPVVAASGASDEKKRAAARLLEVMGEPHFYDVVATIDPAHAADWHGMARIQRRFADAEPGFDTRTRAYSESMRLTLHAALIEHLLLEDDGDLFDRFLALHVTAFRDNGGWFGNLEIGARGARDVIQAADARVLDHLRGLMRGTVVEDEIALRAADHVRAARAAVGR